MTIATLEFDEIGFSLGDNTMVGFFDGSFDIDASGDIVSMVIRTYNHKTHKTGATKAHAESNGLPRLLFYGLAPVIKQQCSGRILEAVLNHRYDEPARRADYQNETSETYAEVA